MGKPGGGRNPVDERFISLFSVFNITFPSEDSLKKIYSSIFGGHAMQLHKDVQALTAPLTEATMELCVGKSRCMSAELAVRTRVCRSSFRRPCIQHDAASNPGVA